MNPFLEFAAQQTRRQFFSGLGIRAGSIALAGMSLPRIASAVPTRNYGSKVHPALPDMPHFKPT
ncbi:MAG TPA: sulfatase, partial [Verrucomicrobiae bacterium]